MASIPASTTQEEEEAPVRHLVLCPCGVVNDPRLPGFQMGGGEYVSEAYGVYETEHFLDEDEMVQEEEEEHVYEGEYEGSDRVVLGVVSTVGDKDEKDDEGEGGNQTDEMNAVEEVGVVAAAPPPATARRGRRRTTAASANRFGRYDLDLDIREMIYGHLEPCDLTGLLSLSKSWHGVRARMHSWLCKRFLGLDERVRAGFKPLPPKTIIQTNAGPVWPEDCLCQPRRTIGNVDAALASLPQLAAAVTTLQRALSLKSVRLHMKELTGRRYSFRGLSLGQESALSCITVGDVHQLAKWWTGEIDLGRHRNSLVMLEGSRGIQMRHLDAPLITYLREEESRLEYSLPVVRAHWCCGSRSAPRWTQPTVGSLRPADHNQTHPSIAAVTQPGFLRELPASVALRIQQAGLPLPTSRFVLTDEFILWHYF